MITYDKELEVLEIGKIIISENVKKRLWPDQILSGLYRHLFGDWGDVDEQGWDANDLAVQKRCRVVSAYESPVHERFLVITEADRSRTTVLLPEDY